MSSSSSVQKKKWEEEECIVLAGEVFHNRKKFGLTLVAKEKTSPWEDIANNMTAKGYAVTTEQAKSKWSRIMVKFNNGILKDENQLKEIGIIFRHIMSERGIIEASPSAAGNQPSASGGVVPPTPPPAAGSNRPTPDEQNKKKRQEKIDELTGFFEKLKIEIPLLESGLHELTERYNTLKLDTENMASKLDELKKME